MKRKALRFKRKQKTKAKPVLPPGIILKTPEQIEGIRKSSHITRDILDMLTERVKPGITTNDIDRWVYDYMIAHNAKPATLNYRGYPKSTCTSLNDKSMSQ